MRFIMVMNAKGGCGKSTLATNLASYYANQGKTVVLADFDPQGSSMEWLEARSPAHPYIKGIAAWRGSYRTPRNTDYVIMDTPAGVFAKQDPRLLRRAHSILIPVLPSAMDMRSTAQFLERLLRHGRVVRKAMRVALVANRVRENTLAYYSLEDFIAGYHRIPFVGSLRESQNYVQAAERGVGLFEMPSYKVQTDLAQWEPILGWLASRRSRPLPR